MLRVGVDVGGTFTDCVLYCPSSKELKFAKVPSTPSNQSEGVLQGIKELVDEQGIVPEEITSLIHGTTVATNTLIERNGARTALITTLGFQDVLHIARQDRPNLYDWRVRRPDPLVPRHLRFEVRERVLSTGEVLTPISVEDIEEIAGIIDSLGIESIAVCFLHSYRNPIHEETILKKLRELLPELPVTISSRILPEYREYERMSAAVINAYVGRSVGTYLRSLQQKISNIHIPAELNVMQSNGGIMPLEEAVTKPVNTILSGPAGGVVGASALAQQAGEENVISVDMGGTSFDIALTYRGDIRRTRESAIEGFAVKLPMIDIHTLGAGGGSIAWIDTGGALRVGPKSAGAEPGPVCYGKGGVTPTVTDANLVLGRIDPEFFLGGKVQLDYFAARSAIEEMIAKPLQLSLEEAAEGIIRIVNANMIKGIRVVSVEKGYDPREFCLMAFGGAGPLHAAELAIELGTPRVLIPLAPGLASALGLLIADYRRDYVQTLLLECAPDEEEILVQNIKAMQDKAMADISRELDGGAEADLLAMADIRYKGQGHELTVPLEVSGPQSLVEAIEHHFHLAHSRSYGYVCEDNPIELVNLRLSAVCNVPKPVLRRDRKCLSENSKRALKGRRDVYINSDYFETAIYDRAVLSPGDMVVGPAVVEQMDTTTLVLPSQIAEVDGLGNILIKSREIR